MSLTVKKVYIAPMKCSNGVFFYVTIVNENSSTITPYQSTHFERAVFESDVWADFFGLVAERLEPNDYVSQETIDSGYKEGRKRTKFAHLNASV